MNTRTIILFFVAAVLVCTYGKSTAQQGNTTVTWKKLVGRTIDIYRGFDQRNYQAKGTDEDSLSLLKMIVDARKTGRIGIYANEDLNFTNKMTDSAFNEWLDPKYVCRLDSIILTDPITGKDTAFANTDTFKYSSIHKYRILEDWTLNPNTGKTVIQIKGIAPVREIFGADGSFRGVQAMFWVRYSDMQPILDRYLQYHPGNSLAGRIWSDYFSNDVKPANKNGDWESNATRVIRIDDRPDTIIHHLVDNDDSSLFDVLMKLKLTGKVPSYPSAVHGFTIQMRKEELNDSEMLSMIQVITDPVSGAEVTKMLPYVQDRNNQKYMILENWRFNPSTGKTEIEITGLAPSIEITGINNIYPKMRPLFWMNYNDVQKVLSKYDQCHPGNSFALHVWNDYFLSDIKPIAEK